MAALTGLTATVRTASAAFSMDLQLTAAAGVTVAILGPNGAGKTTLLRTLAGLATPYDARITLDDLVLDDIASGIHVAAADRPVAVVFQDRALFPHLDAIDNVAFAARAAGRSKREARVEAEGWLRRIGLDPGRWHLKPDALSGGTAQRVALARALSRPSRLLLLDEPLAALDARSRSELRGSLPSLLEEHPGVRLVVTHDVVDAMSLAQAVVVLEDGRVTQSGPFDEVLADPHTEYVAGLADPRHPPRP